MDPKDHLPVDPLKTAITTCGSVVFLVASVVVACRARHYQITGQPMPNGKGGFMTFGDGYLIALVLLLLSLVWSIAAWRYWRSGIEYDLH
jgi:hypothetical protein